MGWCGNGCFSHVSLLCLGWECGASKDVCECVFPGCGFLRAPGLKRTDICCYSVTNTEAATVSADANVPLDIQCMSNLYVCSFAVGQYLPQVFPRLPNRSPNRSNPPSTTAAPEVQRFTKTKSVKEIPGLGKGVSACSMVAGGGGGAAK